MFWKPCCFNNYTPHIYTINIRFKHKNLNTGLVETQSLLPSLKTQHSSMRKRCFTDFGQHTLTNILDVVGFYTCIYNILNMLLMLGWKINGEIGWFLPGKESPETRMMYYLNDGVYGSLNCILSEPHHVKAAPYLQRVGINIFTM